MSAFPILDLVIGLIFIYFLLGLICSVIQEMFAALKSWRANTLNDWVNDTFNRGNFSKDILCHKLIDGLTPKGKLASYIPADKFSHVVFDLIHHKNAGGKPYNIETLQEAVSKTSLINDDLKRMILQSISEADGNIDKVRKDFEGWFNNAMQRVSGTYKKKIQLVILLTSLFLTVFINADSIALAKFLYANPTASKDLADRATQVTKDAAYIDWVNKVKVDPTDTATRADLNLAKESIKQIKTNVQEIKNIKSEIDVAKLPLGWTKVDNWWSKIFGLLITTLAVCLGAPFWFDMLNKLTNLRSTGNKPAK